MQAILCTVSLLAGIALIALGQSGILAYCLIGLGIGGLVVTSFGRKVR